MLYQAHHHGKGIGQTMNALAAHGIIPHVQITFPDNPELKAVACSCMFAATDWLKANGFYSGTIGIDKPRYEFETLEGK